MSETSETSQANQYALPDAWIERIFGRLEDFYGARFHDQWRGTNLKRVKRTWSEKLSRFAHHPGAIRFALDALESKPFPPTLPEFIELCRQAPREALPALPEPKCDQETARRYLAAMNEVIGRKVVP